MIPAGAKRWIKGLAPWRALQAARLARTHKRLDLSAGNLATLFHAAPVDLDFRGKRVLEIGAGWVLSEAVLFHLLGASRVLSTDITPLAQPRFIRSAMQASYPYLIQDYLSHFCPHHELRARVEALFSRPPRTFADLQQLGIHYRAPLDFAQGPLPEQADVIFSFSVLEHVPCADVSALLHNLARSLAPGGVMIHSIHLEDHADLDHPFAFLGELDFDRHAQSRRGNRLRQSDWRRIFAGLAGVECRQTHAWSRPGALLPPLDNIAVAHEGEDDLRVSHLGFFCQGPPP